jgi:uncharacterized protein involved in exopolysaccharide biosynthesis
MDEGLVLGRFIETLLRGWLVIVLMALACVGGAAAFTYSEPTRYQAAVLVATLRESTRVSLGSNIKTLSEDELQKAATSGKERLQSLVVFVHTPNIAEAVLAQVGKQLPAELRGVKRLLAVVNGRVVPGSDMIEVFATTSDPQTSALIANTWAEEYVRQVNLLYEGLSQDAVGAVDGEVQSASDTYTEQQAKLESFLQDDPRDDLNRQIGDYTFLLDSLSLLRRTALYGVVAEQQLAYSATLQSLAEAQRREVSNTIAELVRANSLLRDAADMRAQIRLAGEAGAPTSQTALILLKARMFAQGPRVAGVADTSLPASLDIMPGTETVSADDLVKDLDALVSTLESRRDQLEADLGTLSQALVSGEKWSMVPLDASILPQYSAESSSAGALAELEQTIATYQQKLNDARAALAQQERRLLDLQGQRDLAWQSYDTLVRKQAELAISEQTVGARVRLAAAAPAPEAVKRQTARNLGLAGAAGLLLGILVVWVRDLWRRYRAQTRPAA